MPNLQWRTPDDGQRNWPKHVEFLDKNKFGKISASVGFIIKEICYDVRSRERRIRHMSIKSSSMLCVPHTNNISIIKSMFREF